jgi:hypothetical protein
MKILNAFGVVSLELIPVYLMFGLSARGQVPDATFYLQTQNTISHVPGTITGAADGGTGTAKIIQEAEPYVSASSMGGPSDGADAYAQYAFYFEVLGPAHVNVPILLVANGEATGKFPSATSIHISLGPFAETDTSPGPFSVHQDVYVQTGNPRYNEVALDVFGNGYANASASAHLEAQISIDPSFADADEYSLVFSPNFLPPVNSVPESYSTLWLLGSALGGLVVCRRLLPSATGGG